MKVWTRSKRWAHSRGAVAVAAVVLLRHQRDGVCLASADVVAEHAQRPVVADGDAGEHEDLPGVGVEVAADDRGPWHVVMVSADSAMMRSVRLAQVGE